VATILTDVCLHSLAGSAKTVAAVGADLVAAGGRGALLTHGAALAGNVVLSPLPDATPPPPDAAAAPDGPPADAGPPDATPLPGAGELCGPEPDFCATGHDCWLLLTSDVTICTESCVVAADCVGYGDVCCKRPGFQTTQTVCIPTSYVECSL
jgi:hypothetical protein